MSTALYPAIVRENNLLSPDHGGSKVDEPDKEMSMTMHGGPIANEIRD
jgi:hypothetical protein